MATLMEKDVLLEMTTGAIITLMTSEPSIEKNNDLTKLRNLYRALIKNSSDIFDFENVITQIKDVKNRYVTE